MRLSQPLWQINTILAVSGFAALASLILARNPAEEARLQSLADHGIPTMAVVTRVHHWGQRPNEGSVDYAYDVGGHQFEGEETLWGHEGHDLRVGNQIPILFLADKPEVSGHRVRDMVSTSRTSFIGAAIYGAFAPLLALALLLRSRRHRSTLAARQARAPE